ncbi:MAG: FAD-dependent oxidoreductase [Burkholderiales bacterium]|nr:FAD-dependent oxidoreductase [Burkholderiales bacterium]OJX07670.1 MAG: pyridine nucleotide-disulfide oxidoreductase [Burkholderiales bacterium 70-64]
MKPHKYVIVGGGMTAAAAIGGIREIDADGSIAVICAEMHPPYDRPPLSKALWSGQKTEEAVSRDAGGPGVAIHLGRRAVALDAANKTVTDDAGNVYAYDKLLLATGGAPRRLPFADDGTIYYRTLDDYRQLRRLADRDAGFAVIGGGFIGSEIAAALAMNGKRVTMVFPEEGIGARVYPKGLSSFLNGYFRDKSVTVLPAQSVTGLRRDGTRVLLGTSGAGEVAADAVVAGLGILPAVELAQAAGLAVDNGIVVDEQLRTSHPDIHAAGDVANFYNPALDRRMRVEHEDNANTMGRTAGRNMAGRAEPYHHLPYFYSDLFDLGYEAVGELDARLDMVEDWKEPFRKGVVYYLREGRVRGVLLWNTWGQLETASAMIAAKASHSPGELAGAISD